MCMSMDGGMVCVKRAEGKSPCMVIIHTSERRVLKHYLPTRLMYSRQLDTWQLISQLHGHHVSFSQFTGDTIDNHNNYVGLKVIFVIAEIYRFVS